MLDTSVLRDFEAAVGPANVSDDPAIITSYAWNTGVSGRAPSDRLAPIRPAAVLMPSTTEEVQAVVRACRKHGLHFRAHSTGQVGFYMVMQEQTISIDLRRMNRVVEIDRDNQMAIIEPYATVADVMTAAMKQGLTSHAVGAGWTHSPLASATSLFGIGISGAHTGQNSRNLLAYEWVTPEGDIIRGGSAGADAGWYAGEGPGPGFRGMIRGFCGAAGALGVFTRIGYKLHPWDGPATLEETGQHPNLGMKLSERERVYHAVWPDWEAQVEATYQLMTSKAATFIVRIPADHHGWTFAPTLRDYWDLRRTDSLPEIAREENTISLSLMAVSGSLAEAEWRDRAIRAIIEQTGGRLLALPAEQAEMIARNLTTSCYVARALRGGVCGSLTTFGISDSLAQLPANIARGGDMMAPYKKPGGRFTQGDRDQFWVWPGEGRTVWAENIVPSNSNDDRSLADSVAYAIQTFDANDRNPIGSSGFVMGAEGSELFGPNMGHFQDWMRKVKAAFDPNGSADGDYVNAKRPAALKAWPIVRPILMRSRWLLSKLMLKSLSKAEAQMADPTIATLAHDAARRFGDRTAISFGGGTSLSFADIDDAAGRFAGGLAAGGIGAGDRVILHLPNGAEWIVAYHAIARAGAVVVPCNILCSLAEVAFAATNAQARLAIVPAARANEAGALIEAEILTPADFPAMLSHPCRPPIPCSPHDLFTIAYTSGTTGKPKGAMLSHATIHSSMAHTATTHVRHAGDVVLSALPFPHVYGNIVMNAVFQTGMRLIAPAAFDAGAILRTIAEERVTLFEGVPTMYYQLLAHPDIDTADLSSLTRCTVGGQTMPLGKLAAVAARFGCPVLELWGMTELGGPAVTHSPYWPQRLGSVGLPFPGTEVRVVALDDARRTLPSDEAGELLVRGPLVMQGYWNLVDATADAIDADGWFATGDVGMIGADGYVTIVDRKKDMIITAGYNVYPAELEQAVATHPDVAMAAVAGMPDSEKGEIAHAFVVRRAGASVGEAALIAHCRQHLASYKLPRVVHFVDELPKTSSGKLMRRALAALMTHADQEA